MVEFGTKSDAEAAIKGLSGETFMTQKLAVDWAFSVPQRK